MKLPNFAILFVLVLVIITASAARLYFAGSKYPSWKLCLGK